MADRYIQVGILCPRDPVTGIPKEKKIPLYALERDVPEEDPLSPTEKELLTDVAGIFAHYFREYQNGVREAKKAVMEERRKQEALTQARIRDAGEGGPSR